jgi:hypothetical protein
MNRVRPGGLARRQTSRPGRKSRLRAGATRSGGTRTAGTAAVDLAVSSNRRVTRPRTERAPGWRLEGAPPRHRGSDLPGRDRYSTECQPLHTKSETYPYGGPLHAGGRRRSDAMRSRGPRRQEAHRRDRRQGTGPGAEATIEGSAGGDCDESSRVRLPVVPARVKTVNRAGCRCDTRVLVYAEAKCKTAGSDIRRLAKSGREAREAQGLAEEAAALGREAAAPSVMPARAWHCFGSMD